MKSLQLRTFLAVTSDGSFSRAARRVHVSQSTASLHVKELEDAVGVRLLERASDGVRPTAAGRVMLAYAERMLALEQEALAQVRASAAVPTGLLRLASSTAPAEVHLPRILAAYRARWPAVEVAVRVSASDAALTALRAGDCELALVGWCTADPELACRAFADDEIVLVGGAHLPDPTPEALPLVAREPGSGTRAAVAGLVPDGLRPHLTVDSTEALRRCVLEGAGFAFLSRAGVADEVAAGRLRVVPWPGTPMRRSLFVARRERVPLSPAGEALLALLG